jgi:peptidoglycan-associated lipoprotein
MRRLHAGLFVLFPLLMASKCRKGNDKDTGPTDIVPPPVEQRLQLSSVDPDRIDAGQPAKVQIWGDGFQPGARVWADESEVAVVNVVDATRLSVTLPPMPPGPHDLRVRNTNGEEATLRGAFNAFNPHSGNTGDDPATRGLNCEQITVYFDFDKSSLRGEDQATLQRHLPCFTTRSGTVRIEGHADERGTTEYNIALGQRRADAVTRWLSGQGVPPSRIRTVSYGEERPAVGGSGEGAWAKNRRVEAFPAR